MSKFKTLRCWQASLAAELRDLIAQKRDAQQGIAAQRDGLQAWWLVIAREFCLERDKHAGMIRSGGHVETVPHLCVCSCVACHVSQEQVNQLRGTLSKLEALRLIAACSHIIVPHRILPHLPPFHHTGCGTIECCTVVCIVPFCSCCIQAPCPGLSLSSCM